MSRRSPFLLWRFITADLFRLITLSAAVLVAVIALAAAVKPVSDGLLQSENFLKFVLYAMPPMLAYALPFAAGFGATLVYHRLAHDNEAVAAHAGGISHKSLLAPAMGMGLVLAIVLVLLNEALIPYFLFKMQRLITRDLATWVVQEIEKGKSVEMGGMMVHARSAERLPPAPGSAATDVLHLTKVAAIERDNAGNPESEVTSEHAWLIMFPWEGFGNGGNGGDGGGEGSVSAADQGKSRVIMRLENFVGKKGKSEAGARKSADVGWSIPNPFRDNVKFLSWRELREISATPERMNWIDIWRKDLAFCVAERQISLVLRNQAGTGSLVLRDDQGADVTIDAVKMEPFTRPAAAAPSANAWKLSPAPGKNLTVRLRHHGVAPAANDPAVTITAPHAVLTIDIGSDRLDRALSMRLEMENVTVDEEGARPSTQRPTYRVSNLRPMNDPTAGLLTRTSPQLLVAADEATRQQPATPQLIAAVNDLAERIARLKREVLAKQNERMVMAASCFVMVFTGAVIALRLSKRLPLTVYMFTFLPAVLCIVTMSGGQQMTVQSGTPGLFLMWSGVAGLLLYTLLQYRALARH